MTKLVLVKTAKGREEIKTRKHQLARRLRALLVLIDGKHSREDLLDQYSDLGINDDSITELIVHDFIESIPAPEETVSPEDLGNNACSADGYRFMVSEQNTIMVAERQSSEPENLAEKAAQYHAIYSFYTQTIRNTLGLRGFILQLKVERAGSVDELRALQNEYLDAVHKAKGAELAASLRARLDQLLKLSD